MELGRDGVLNLVIRLMVDRSNSSSRITIVLTLTSAWARERLPIDKFEPSSSIEPSRVEGGSFGVVASFHDDLRRHRSQLPRLSGTKCVEYPRRGMNASSHPRAMRHRVVQRIKVEPQCPRD
jgi:hypothetical protein